MIDWSIIYWNAREIDHDVLEGKKLRNMRVYNCLDNADASLSLMDLSAKRVMN